MQAALFENIEIEERPLRRPSRLRAGESEPRGIALFPSVDVRRVPCSLPSALFELTSPTRHLSSVGDDAPTGAVFEIEDARRERPCPTTTASRKASSLLPSLFFHAGLIAAALLALPQLSAPVAERGGTDQPLDVIVVGAQEAQAQQEGGTSSAETSEIAEPVAEAAATPPAPTIAEEVVDPVPLEAIPAPAVETLAATKPAEESASLAPAPPSEPAAPQPIEATSLTVARSDETISPPPSAPVQATPAAVQPVAVPKETAKAPSPSRKPPTQSPRHKIRTQRPAAASPAGSATAKGKSGQGEAQANRAATAAGGTGGAAATAGRDTITDYRARVVAHLTRYKTYPEQARERGETGRNAVRITLARDGSVSVAVIASPSGHPLLDAATLAAVRRAQPFPAIPEGGPATFTLAIGLAYALR